MRRWLAVSLVAAVCAVVLVRLAMSRGFETAYTAIRAVPPAPAAEDRDSIALSFHRYQGDDYDLYSATYTTTSRTAIDAFGALIASAAETSDHKCAPVGTVTVTRAGGVTRTYRILPGHDPAFYEYRYEGKIYRVPRSEFVAAMELLGACDLPTGR